MKRKIYISGPITGVPRDICEANFQRAETYLCDRWEVVNPFKETPFDLGWDWTDYLKKDIKLLLDCTAIYMLKGWPHSKGALLERHIAEGLGYTVLYEDPS